MNKQKETFLGDLLEDTIKEKNKIEKGLNQNLDRIKEIDTFIDSIVHNEESDFKVFSPRTEESLHRKELDQVREEKKILENSNNSYYRELGKLESHIEKLKYVISENTKKDTNMHLALIDIQEKERSRIAKELHDSSLQSLAHLIHVLELGTLFIDQDPVRAKLEFATCSQNLRQIVEEIRDTIFNLRPMSFDDLGFKHTIENYIDKLKVQYNNITFVCDIDDILVSDFSYDDEEESTFVLLNIYRVIQEAVQNVMKHSDADKLELIVKNNEANITIKIIDNGKGFHEHEIESNHFGISIMKERIHVISGKIEIISKDNVGTRIFISIPK